MKTLITLNIGLETTKGTRLDVHHAIGAVQACGVSITTSAVVNGEWQGKAEQTLFIQGFVADPYAVGFRAQLYLASKLLSQHCIALWVDGAGELFGDNPDKYEFDAELFHFHPEGKNWNDTRIASKAEVLAILESPQLSPCQAIQKEHAERIQAAKELDAACESAYCKRHGIIDGYSKDGFCDYLHSQLIPDLCDAGMHATAQDFETARQFILAR